MRLIIAKFYFLRTLKISLPSKEVDVKLPRELADKLNPIAIKIGEEYSLYGIRAKINFRTMLKALALRNGRHVVSIGEFDELLEIADYMNFKYNPIR